MNGQVYLPVASQSVSVWQTGWLVFLLTLCLYGLTAGGSMATDIMTYEVTKSMVERQSVEMPDNLFGMDAHRGTDGRYYAPYGIGHAIYSVPFYVAGRTVEQLAGTQIGRSESLRKAAVATGSAVAAAGAVWLVFSFAWSLVGKLRPAVATALAFGFSTMLWPYSKFGFNAPLATFCVLAGVYGVWVGVRGCRSGMLVCGGIGLGFALLIRLELVLVTVPVGFWLLLEYGPDWKRFLKNAMTVAAPVAAALLVTGYYNLTRFGNPLDTGYLRDDTAGFGSIWTGAWGLLVSPGGSVFLYSPLLILGVWALADLARSDRRTAFLFGGVVLTLFCFYSTLAHWDADRSYGPRYLLPGLAFLCMPLVSWFALKSSELKRQFLLVALLVSTVVQVPGVLVDFSKVGHTEEIGYRSFELRRWEWQSSALVLNTKAALAAVPRNVRHLVGSEPLPAVEVAEGEARDFSSQFAHSLDFWWMYLFHLGLVQTPLVIVLAGIPLGLAGLIVSHLRRLLFIAG
jgi:hypothetical protein